MKIAVIGSRGYPFVYSGYETFVKETFELLADKYVVHVYCHKSLFRDKPSVYNGIYLHYIPAIDHKVLNQLSNSFLATLHALIFGKYDVILFVNTANGPFGLLTRLCGIKTAIITDGLEWLRPKWSGVGSKYFLWASKLSTKLFDVLISDSKEMKRIYLDKFNVNSEIIEYGAHVKASKNADKISKFGLVKNGYYLIVGRLIPDNNSDIIVEGFSKSNTSKKLVIVGDVPYQDEFSLKIKSFASERIIFTGYVYDQDVLMELYSNSYVYIHGHEYGGTNPTLLKALAYGCSILALDTPFSREVLKDNNHGSYFVKNSSSVKEAIEKLDDNPLDIEEQKNRSRSRIEDYYNWERIANLYDLLFQKMNSSSRSELNQNKKIK